MWVHFDFDNGANPYISTSDKALFFMVCNYALAAKKPIIANARVMRFTASKTALATTYRKKQAALREFAIEFSHASSEYAMSWGDVSDWGGFFEHYGRRYGLLTEFRENAIC